MNFKGKRFIVLGVSLLFLFTMTGVSFAALSDIEGHWAADQIKASVTQGLVSSYPDGSFKPDNNITRAEFITMTNRAYKFDTLAPINYSDVPADAWFANEIAKASAAGYISGDNNSTVRPDQPISRQEAAVILARMCKLNTTSDMSVVNKFKDADSIPEWSKGAVGAVINKGYMNGYADQTYRPEKFMTRAEAIVTLGNAIKNAAELKPDNAEKPSDATVDTEPEPAKTHEQEKATNPEQGNTPAAAAITLSGVEMTKTFGAFKFDTDTVTTDQAILAGVKVNGAALQSVEKRSKGADGTAWKGCIADPQYDTDYTITCEEPFAITGNCTVKWSK